jgi:hypothetical protein
VNGPRTVLHKKKLQFMKIKHSISKAMACQFTFDGLSVHFGHFHRVHCHSAVVFDP